MKLKEKDKTHITGYGSPNRVRIDDDTIHDINERIKKLFEDKTEIRVSDKDYKKFMEGAETYNSQIFKD